MGLKRLYTGLRNNSQPNSHWHLFKVTIHNPFPTWFPHDCFMAVLVFLLTPGFESQKYLVPLNTCRGRVFPAHFEFKKIVRHMSFRISGGVRTCPVVGDTDQSRRRGARTPPVGVGGTDLSRRGGLRTPPVGGGMDLCRRGGFQTPPLDPTDPPSLP